MDVPRTLDPGKAGQPPPLQNLGFDPGSAWEKMQKIILPGGSSQLAVNVSMAHRESTLVSVLKGSTDFSLGASPATQARVEHSLTQATAE